jgi:sn-glycerol 3-phosphate transport system permease protein
MVLLLPIYLAIVAASHSSDVFLTSPIPFLPGTQFFSNFKTVLFEGMDVTGGHPIAPMLYNSLIMALMIAIGKIVISVMSAYSLIYFDFRFKKLCFWLIFLTLMLPVEVRIVPTFQVAANLSLLNSYTGLTLPLIASATATFLFRQFFMTIPKELVEAAKIDGAGAVKFFFDMILPLSKNNIAALFIIMFIYGWNQYLWPLVITTKPKMTTIVMGIQHLAGVADQVPQWHFIMAVALCAILPPLLIIILMQSLFVKGLIDTEK